MPSSQPSPKRRPARNRILLYVYYFSYAILYAWLLTHHSTTPWLFHYSGLYTVFLLFALGPFLLPPALHILLSRWSWRDLIFALLPTLVLLTVVYVISSFYYYQGQVHPFDPFLQMPPARFDVEGGHRSDDAYRILTMGGSTTQFSVYPETAKDSLEKELPGVEVEIFNAGVAYWTTKHSLINYVTYADNLEPDLVVVMHAINDLVRSCEPPDNSMGPYNDDWSHFYGPAIYAARPLTFERHLFLTYFGIVYSFYANSEVDFDPGHFRSIKPFRGHLRRIVRYARNNDSDVLLVTQPSRFEDQRSDGPVQPSFGSVFCKSDVGFMKRVRPSGRSMRRAMAAFNTVVREVADAEGALLLDAAATMDGSESFFYDEVHTTGLGGQSLGRAVAHLILERGLIERRIREDETSRSKLRAPP